MLERMQLRAVLSSEFTLTRERNGQMESGPKEANWERGGSKGWIWSRYVTYMCEHAMSPVMCNLYGLIKAGQV